MNMKAWDARDAAERLARALKGVRTVDAMLAVMADHLDAARAAGGGRSMRAPPPAYTGSDLAGRLTAEARDRLAQGGAR